MKTNRKIIKIVNWALAGVLTLLGFAGCDTNYGPEEYGTPNADFSVKGVVVDKETGKAIKGISVSYRSFFEPMYMYGTIQTSFEQKSQVLTDEKGEFKITKNEFDNKQVTFPVFVEDIDGEENGLYQSDTLKIDFNSAELSGKSNSWYGGEYSVIYNVELSKIEEEE